MNATELVSQLFDKAYHWHKIPANVKIKAVVLYFRGLYLRSLQKYLSDESYHVNIRFFYIKHRLRDFYKKFPWYSKYETAWTWLVSLITPYFLLELKVDTLI